MVELRLKLKKSVNEYKILYHFIGNFDNGQCVNACDSTSEDI